VRYATCIALFLTALFGGTLAGVRVVVTEVTGQGAIHRGVLDTADCGDTDRCTELIGQAALEVPPPYRPLPGRPVYHICADDTIVLVARRDLVGPLLELVMTTLAGEHPLAAQRAAGEPSGGGQVGRHGPLVAVTQPDGSQHPAAPDLPDQPGPPGVAEKVPAADGS
jgi:hypothetical protein